MAGPVHQTLRDVRRDVPPADVCDQAAAENVLSFFRTKCGRAMLDAPPTPNHLEAVSLAIGTATRGTRENAAIQAFQVARANEALNAARWVLEFFAANRNTPASALPPEAARKLSEALAAVGSAYQT